MSIIYNTLDRLEKEGYAKTEGIAQTEYLNVPDTAARKTEGRKVPVKPLVLIFTLVLAAAALTIWQKNYAQKASGDLPATVEERVADTPAETEKPTLASIIAAQPAVDAQEKLPTTATVVTDEPAVEVLPKAVEVPEPVAPLEKAMPKGLAATESVEPMDVTLSNAPIETRLEGDRDASVTDSVPETIPRGRLVTPSEESATVEQPVVKTTEPAVDEVKQKNTASNITAEPVVSVVATPGSDRKASEPFATTRPSSQTPLQTLTQPNVVDETLERVRVALSYGQYMRALSELSGLSPRPTGRADYWFMKGSAHLGLEQLNQAEEAFEAAQTLLPDQPQIAVQLAIINQEKGDHEKAVKILSKAAESHPNVPEIFLNQGYSLLTLGAVREAEHNFRIFMRMTERRAVYAEQRQAVKQWLGKAAFNDK